MNWRDAWEIHKDEAAEHAHIGWMQAKQSHGWADHPLLPRSGDSSFVFCHKEGCTLGRYKHHSDMIPFADLSPEIQQYDYDTAVIGFEIGFNAGHTAGFEDGYETGAVQGQETGYARAVEDREERLTTVA